MSYNDYVKNRKRVVNVKNVFFAVVAIIFGVIILIFVFKNNNKISVPHNNIVDSKISQYSDKNITQNAIATNFKFKDIAFNVSVPSKKIIFSNQIAAVARAIKSLTGNEPKNAAKEYGSWIWTPIMDMTPEYVESMLSDAKANNINVIYLSIDTYLDIFVMPNGQEREKQKEDFSNKLADFINRANQKGIAVDAEAGWRNWAEDDNIYKAFAIVNYVKNFNNTHQDKFRGFQYDVEPYLLDSYDKNKASVLGNFVELIDKTENFLAMSPLRFSVVVPDFFDGKDNMTPKFSYNGSNEYTFKHLLNILDKKLGGSIIIMSYRNFADGKDGSIEVSNNEIQTANSGAYNTKIIIAQETGNFPPPYITFHNTSKKYLLNQIEQINNTFNSYSNFGGIAVHYTNAFFALK